MAVYKAPLRDMRFVLDEVFSAQELWATMPGTEEITSDLVDAILEEGAKVTENLLFPLNQSGDEEGCHYNNGEVTTPTGFPEAYKTYAEGGWVGLGGSVEYGGQGMPKMLTVLYEEMVYAANTSFALYPVLTAGANLAILSHATEALKQTYLPKMYSGEWAGSMCLTESHAGSDLGIMRTKAEPNTDGSYAISGTKIFITGGEHNLTDNIIHLVLAKLPDAPGGSKGISLFLVPKFLLNEDGSLGERNTLGCGSIEHKMGIRGSATTVMNFDGAKGWLIGEENQGLACMFTMMNYERLSIGIQGLGLGEVSYQNAAAYAKDRIQGRAPTGAKNSDKAADTILVHPDVRRMLLTQRALNEAGRAFAVYVGMYLDIAKFHADDESRQHADGMVGLLTPIAKALLTDKGLDVCIHGQQVLGGHGYICEWGLEQFVRDARIAQIYEGTNGIQALDLVGRKVVRNGGQYCKLFTAEVAQFITNHESNEALQDFVVPLRAAIQRLDNVTQWIVDHAQTDPNEIGAASVEYLHLFGLTLYAYLWAKMASVAVNKQDDEFYQAKLTVGRFFMQKLLPQSVALVESIEAGAESLMKLDEKLF